MQHTQTPYTIYTSYTIYIIHHTSYTIHRTPHITHHSRTACTCAIVIVCSVHSDQCEGSAGYGSHQATVFRRTEITHTSQPSHYTHMHAHMHTHMHTCTHARTHAHLHTGKLWTQTHAHRGREGEGEGDGRQTTGLVSPWCSQLCICHVGSAVPVTLQQQPLLRCGSSVLPAACMVPTVLNNQTVLGCATQHDTLAVMRAS